MWGTPIPLFRLLLFTIAQTHWFHPVYRYLWRQTCLPARLLFPLSLPEKGFRSFLLGNWNHDMWWLITPLHIGFPTRLRAYRIPLNSLCISIWAFTSLELTAHSLSPSARLWRTPSALPIRFLGFHYSSFHSGCRTKYLQEYHLCPWGLHWRPRHHLTSPATEIYGCYWCL